ncbi:dicarboxylate/amino acid:cation symporter [Haematospirillum sp. H1815]|uniref:dicarboxylate/amino acid:cation symporter n=1 Tax=Haematospirillum sp. H1815 TaxID=2723108 RepID=UPI00143C991D|nr:dicarboxylate/amino acid:cation symporter [Haematospirillum sp. H1815]NKD76670.1 dicarboxylate/amino acid:cation symporter [Haematospirillum sp. H1815]
MLPAWMRVALWKKVVAGFVAGGIAGYMAGPQAAVWFKPIGDVYITLIRMLVVPLLLTSIVSSVAGLGSIGGALRLGVKTVLYFILTAALASAVGIATGLLLEPGIGIGQLAVGEARTPVIPGPVDVLLSVVPSNPFQAMAEGHVLQVLFVSLLFGGSLAVLGERAALLRSCVTQANEAVMQIVRLVLQLTPIGTFGLIAWVVGTSGAESLLPLGHYILALYVACLFHLFVVYGGLLSLHGLDPRKFFRGVAPAMQVAFVTASSFASLPLTLSCTTRRLGVAQDYASFAVPLGASMKMDGCGAIFPAIATLFIAQYTGVELSAGALLTVFVIGVVGSLATAGVPGPSIVMLTLTLGAVGLPLEAIGYIVAVDRVVDMMRTATNVTGQALVPVLVARFEKGLLDDERYGCSALVEDDVAPDSAASLPDTGTKDKGHEIAR